MGIEIVLDEGRAKELGIKAVVKQDWEESEKDWGVRPDGCSYHMSFDDCKEFRKQYWSRMPKEVPYEYSREYGRPYLVEVTEEMYEQVKKSKNGLRIF